MSDGVGYGGATNSLGADDLSGYIVQINDCFTNELAYDVFLVSRIGR